MRPAGGEIGDQIFKVRIIRQRLEHVPPHAFRRLVAVTPDHFGRRIGKLGLTDRQQGRL